VAEADPAAEAEAEEDTAADDADAATGVEVAEADAAAADTEGDGNADGDGEAGGVDDGAPHTDDHTRSPLTRVVMPYHHRSNDTPNTTSCEDSMAEANSPELYTHEACVAAVALAGRSVRVKRRAVRSHVAWNKNHSPAAGLVRPVRAHAEHDEHRNRTCGLFARQIPQEVSRHSG
jgi:hypothetical protein